MGYAEFRDYYAKCLGMSDEDRTAFFNAVESPLPMTFRVTNVPEAERIKEELSKFSFLKKIERLDSVYTYERVIKSRSTERAANNDLSNDASNDISEYKRFMNFLITQTDAGNIQRQELVSMLPHFLLDLAPSSKVLETCASPGSKTKQILEVVTDGLVVSNDKSYKRINILITETRKKPSRSLVITQMDASLFPNMNIKFDRICCDVPCTSDGTIRKNPDVRDKWRESDGVSLCKLQARILRRAIDNLSDEGLLVYSTCSLNPVENENVIDEILKEGMCELVESRSKLEELGIKTRCGLSEYSGCFNIKTNDIKTNDIKTDDIKTNDIKSSGRNEELKKCIRIYPQDQNTGGFFMAVLRKKGVLADLPKDSQPGELPKDFHIAPNETELKSRYKIEGAGENDRFISKGKTDRILYAVSESAFDFVRFNPKVKVVYTGTRAFELTNLKVALNSICDNDRDTVIDTSADKDALGDKDRDTVIGTSANNEKATNNYRILNEYLLTKIKCSEIQGTPSDFKKLVENEEIHPNELSFSTVGHFVVNFPFIKRRFCGFYGKTVVFIYANKFYRKALCDLKLAAECDSS